MAALATVTPEPPLGETSDDRIRALLAGFQGPLPRKPTSPWYFLGLLVTTVVMVLLPVIYLGLIALVGLTAYWHLANNHTMLQGVRGKGAVIVFLAYLAPAIVGAILVLFMIKPLFSRPAQRSRRRSLKRQDEPILFALVDRICELVHAPKPKRIDVDCDINASASFRAGWWSLVRGSDLALTIGMPLVAGLSLKQLAGVLAHEFGHFSQGAGMRLTYVIRSINFWFLRVAYERDQWDEWLAQTAGSIDLRLGWVLYLAMLCVWLTRKLLWLLMTLGGFVAGFMLRQMEYDADTYEARLVGSDTFAATARQLTVLNLSYQGAMADLGYFHREGRLVDSLPTLIRANIGQIPPHVLAKLEEHAQSQQTGLADTHPCDKDRIAAAAQFPPGGVFHCDLPAEALFVDYARVARDVTNDLYRAQLESGFDPASVHSVDLLLARQQRDKRASDAFSHFMLGMPQSLRPFTVERQSESAATEDLRGVLERTRFAMRELAGAYAEAYREYDQCDTLLLEGQQCEQLLGCGIAPRADHFERRYGSTIECGRSLKALQDQKAQCEAPLVRFEELASRRMGAALAMLAGENAATQNDLAERQTEAELLARVVERLAGAWANVMQLRDLRANLSALFAYYEGNEENERLHAAIRSQAERLHRTLTTVWSSFGDLPYPFDHAAGAITIQSAWAKSVPGLDDLGDLHSLAGDVVQGAADLYSRSIARLSELAEEVERGLGMEPLEAISPPTDSPPS